MQQGSRLAVCGHVSNPRKPKRIQPRERLAAAVLEALEPRRLLSTVTVMNGADAGTGSLRDALANAAPGDTIDFAPSVREVDLSSAGLTLSKNVTIVNDQGAGPVTVNGGVKGYTVFSVNLGVTASISGLTVTGGSGSATGGGVYNDGTLTLNNDTIQQPRRFRRGRLQRQWRDPHHHQFHRLQQFDHRRPRRRRQ